MKVLIVEDNENIREAVSSFLELENYEVMIAGDIHKAERLLSKEPDLILLDIMLPDGNGYQFAKEVRSSSDTPIIFLTAKGSESERIKGFEVGADDYITKPFSLKELSLRVEAVLRRLKSRDSAGNKIYTANGATLEISNDKHTLKVSGERIELTPTEWLILDYLIENKNIVLSKERILESCLGYSSDSSDRVVITHIKNIREKLGEEKWIETVRGFGYRFIGEE